MSGSYKPVFLPVTISWNGHEWAVQGDAAIMTPIGTFSIGAKYKLDRLKRDDVRIIMRDRGTGTDTIYELKNRTGGFSATINGTTKIAVINRTVTIDITDAHIHTIEFRPSQALPEEEAGDGPFTPVADHWKKFWKSNFYHPGALARWAYDDSTLGKGYGAGTLWFLVRLLLAVVMLVVDVFLTFFCLVAATAYLLFGPTGRNVIYGLGALIVATPLLKLVTVLARAR